MSTCIRSDPWYYESMKVVIIVLDSVLFSHWVYRIYYKRHTIHPELMVTSWRWIGFGITGLCEGNPLVAGDFLYKGPVIRNIDVSVDDGLNKLLNEQPNDHWFETPWRSRGATVMIWTQLALCCDLVVGWGLLKPRSLISRQLKKGQVMACCLFGATAFRGYFVQIDRPMCQKLLIKGIGALD